MKQLPNTSAVGNTVCCFTDRFTSKQTRHCFFQGGCIRYIGIYTVSVPQNDTVCNYSATAMFWWHLTPHPPKQQYAAWDTSFGHVLHASQLNIGQIIFLSFIYLEGSNSEKD